LTLAAVAGHEKAAMRNRFRQIRLARLALAPQLELVLQLGMKWGLFQSLVETLMSLLLVSPLELAILLATTFSDDCEFRIQEVFLLDLSHPGTQWVTSELAPPWELAILSATEDLAEEARCESQQVVWVPLLEQSIFQ
jgi:hypothetical protein